MQNILFGICCFAAGSLTAAVGSYYWTVKEYLKRKELKELKSPIDEKLLSLLTYAQEYANAFVGAAFWDEKRPNFRDFTVSLTRADFEALIGGREVQRAEEIVEDGPVVGVRIILSDIGLDVMQNCLDAETNRIL